MAPLGLGGLGGLLLNLASGTPCAGDGHAGGHNSCDSCDNDISFLQAELRFATRAGRAPPAPLLKPIGRSFFSEDPANSAKWWLRYSSSEQLPPEKMMTVGLDQSSESAAVMVKSKGEEVEKLYFLNVNDWKSPSNLTMKDFVQAAKLSWGSVMKREQLYSPWTDFHDGHTSDTIRLDHFEEDNHLFQLYPDHGVARAYVPNTTWTIEWRKGAATEYMNPSTKAYGKKVSFPRPDKCRNFSNDENPERTYWKSTFPVLNASAAKEFALDVLHAKPLEKENPFPWPRQPGCIVAWTQVAFSLRSEGFSFISGYQGVEPCSIKEDLLFTTAQPFATVRSEGPFAVPVWEASKRIIFGGFTSRGNSFPVLNLVKFHF